MTRSWAESVYRVFPKTPSCSSTDYVSTPERERAGMRSNVCSYATVVGPTPLLRFPVRGSFVWLARRPRAQLRGSPFCKTVAPLATGEDGLRFAPDENHWRSTKPRLIPHGHPRTGKTATRYAAAICSPAPTFFQSTCAPTNRDSCEQAEQPPSWPTLRCNSTPPEVNVVALSRAKHAAPTRKYAARSGIPYTLPSPILRPPPPPLFLPRGSTDADRGKVPRTERKSISGPPAPPSSSTPRRHHRA